MSLHLNLKNLTTEMRDRGIWGRGNSLDQATEAENADHVWIVRC